MKLTDYVADFLSQQGVTHVFGLTGGAAVHLFESVDQHARMTPVFCHHEQAAAFATQGWSRVRNSPGACMVTTGPGGTNALTGVTAAWLDSVPCFYFSGQVRLAHMGRGTPLRQVGTQHLNIVPIVGKVTKYAVTIDDVNDIRYHLEKAAWLALKGRPGPVWIDIPLDMQWLQIEPSELRGFDPAEMEPERALPQAAIGDVDQVLTLLKEAQRPIVLAGYGIRLGKAESVFREVIEKLGVPFLASWNASDMIEGEHPLHTGRPGMFGMRGANLAMQNCDLLVSIGSHLCVTLTGTMFDAFAREAKIVMVDIDRDELEHRTVRVDHTIHADAKSFLELLRDHPQFATLGAIDEWRGACVDFKNRFNRVPLEWHTQAERVNPYVFMEQLSDQLGPHDQIVIDGGGTVNQIGMQTLSTKMGQRLIISGGLCSMGSGLPESVGAAFAHREGRTIMLCGDGSMQLNVQELQTIVHHQLPVKIFILANQGYVSIRATQNGFLNGHHLGSSTDGGTSTPDYTKVGTAYGLQTMRIDDHSELEAGIKAALAYPGPCLCELTVSPNAAPQPSQGFVMHADGTGTPRPLEDMAPFLDRKEFEEVMFIKPHPASMVADSVPARVVR